MISYDKAKERALNHIDGEVHQINCAYELPEAYIFDHDSYIYPSHVPLAVLKKNGDIMPFHHFMLKYKHKWDELRPIYFDTGARIPESELPHDEDDEDDEE